MRRKLWPKAPTKEGALGEISKKFQVYFIHIIFFKKTDKKINNRAKELYCDATIFVFWLFIVYLPKKKWKLKNGSRLLIFSYWNSDQLKLVVGNIRAIHPQLIMDMIFERTLLPRISLWYTETAGIWYVGECSTRVQSQRSQAHVLLGIARAPWIDYSCTRKNI